MTGLNEVSIADWNQHCFLYNYSVTLKIRGNKKLFRLERFQYAGDKVPLFDLFLGLK